MQIHEVARQLNISARTIRFYEEKGLLSPARDETSQYRTFTEQEIWRLQTVTALREVGMSLTQIKEALTQFDSGNKDKLLHDLELQRSAMAATWLEYKQHMLTIERFIMLLKEDQALPLDEVYRLAEGSRRLRELRSGWRDLWDFDEQASVHDRVVLTDNEQYEHYSEMLDTVVRWIHPLPGEAGIDLGAGTGNLSARFLRKGNTMMAVDQSKEMVRVCRSKHPELETRLGNMLAIPSLDQTFDFAVSSFALHHLTDEQKLLGLEEMRRVLKPKGRICIADVMLDEDEDRELFMQKLREEGKPRLLHTFEHKFPASVDKLTKWFESKHSMTKQKQFSKTLHILCAIPIR